MALTEYLIRFIMEARFDGKKYALAKAFGMHDDIFRRLFRQLSNGHDSPTLLEKAILFCMEDENIDIKEVLDDFMVQRGVHPATQMPCPYMEIDEWLVVEVKSAHDKHRKYKDLARLFGMAEAMLKQVHVVCCGQGADSAAGCDYYWKWRAEGKCEDNPVDKCPCQLYGAFLKSLKDSLLADEK